MNKHLYLQNPKKKNSSYNRKRNFAPKKEDNDEEKLPKIIGSMSNIVGNQILISHK